MIWFYIAVGVVLFLFAAGAIATVLVIASAADGYERLMESEGAE